MSEHIDHDTLLALVHRAAALYRKIGLTDLYDNHTSIVLNLEFAHRQIPLDAAALLAADDENFAHDILGIRRHMNRRTGELEGCFVPRFAKANAHHLGETVEALQSSVDASKQP